jgi:predicted dehydrogenase
MERIRVGIIGCGGLGRTHAACLDRIAKAEIVAYADLAPGAAEALLQEFGGRYATTENIRVIEDDSIAAVYICTRHDSHADLAIAAARAGKHVLIEKPLALSLEACMAIAEAVAASGVHLMPAFKMRYYPLVTKAKEFIPTPQVIVGQMMDKRWSDSFWAQDPLQGGNVHGQGCHTTDILRYFAGSEPLRVWAAGGTMTHPGHPCIDQCVAAIQFEGVTVASWIQGDAGVGQFTSKFFFELFGDGRSVQLHDRLKKAVFSDGSETWAEERAEEEGFQLENEEFIAALCAGRPPALTAHDGVQATRMVLAAEAAIRTGAVQEICTQAQRQGEEQ